MFYFVFVCFREKVNIPYDKPYIILKGEGKRKTLVEWGDHDSTAQSPTFTAVADNVVVKCMSFRVRILLLALFTFQERTNCFFFISLVFYYQKILLCLSIFFLQLFFIFLLVFYDIFPYLRNTTMKKNKNIRCRRKKR